MKEGHRDSDILKPKSTYRGYHSGSGPSESYVASSLYLLAPDVGEQLEVPVHVQHDQAGELGGSRDDQARDRWRTVLY